MQSLMILLFFILGLVFGSFFNVAGLRIPRRQPFMNERSVCPNCHHQLRWFELLPVVSYIFLGGRCLACKTRISIWYPIIELTTACLFAWSYIDAGLSKELPASLLFISLLVVIFVSDINYMLIPNRIILFFLPLLLAARLIQPLEPWWSSIAGALAGVLIVSLIIVISKGGMGAGDMKLFALIGIMLGFSKTLLALFLSCIIGALIGLVLLALEIINRKQPMPFGPFIVIASIIAYFQGDALINWYISIF